MTWVPAFLFFLLNSEISALLSWKGGNEAGLPTVAPLRPIIALGRGPGDHAVRSSLPAHGEVDSMSKPISADSGRGRESALFPAR